MLIGKYNKIVIDAYDCIGYIWLYMINIIAGDTEACTGVTADMCCDADATCYDRVGLGVQCTCKIGFYDRNFDGTVCGK